MEAKVSNLMRRGAITCTDDSTVREVAQVMVLNRIGYCVVLDPKHEVVGIVSLRSILDAFDSDLDKKKAKDVLAPNIPMITPKTSLKEAIGIMNKNREEQLVVISDRPGSKAVLGLLRAKDIIRSMVKVPEVKE
jgi:predicted transcriptional regulator